MKRPSFFGAISAIYISSRVFKNVCPHPKQVAHNQLVAPICIFMYLVMSAMCLRRYFHTYEQIPIFINNEFKALTEGLRAYKSLFYEI
jgi:hypothetical protein